MAKVDSYVNTIGKLTSTNGKQRGKLTLDQLQAKMGEQFVELKRMPKVAKNEVTVNRQGRSETITPA